MLDSDKPQQMPDYRLEVMDNELLLYHPVATKALYLNETASLVWQLCDGQRSVETIRSLLQQAYPQTNEQITKDVRFVLKQFLKQGMVKLI